MKFSTPTARLSDYLLIAFILIAGMFFRVRQLGYDPFFQDQAATSMGALDVLEGNWPMDGPMEFSSISDPPLPSYMYAIPYSISGDPRVARIFTALWNLLSIALAYKIGTRYFGRGTGIVASALYTAHPTAVIASRFIWNPNLASPFIMLYIYTGLLGYYDSRRLARILHLPILAISAMCHPSLIFLAPVTLLFWMWSWCNRPKERRDLALQGIISVGLAILIVAPWLYANLNTTGQIRPLMAIGSWVHLQVPDINVTKSVLAGEGCWRNNCPMLIGDRPTLFLTHLLPSITILAAIWTISLGAIQRQILAPLALTAVFFLPPSIAAATGRVFDHYVWPLIGAIVIIQAAVLNYHLPSMHGLTRHCKTFFRVHIKDLNRFVQVAYAVTLALILIGLSRFNFRYDPQEGLPSLNQNIGAIQYAMQSARDARVELILQDYQPADELRCIGCRGWETLPALLGENLRILPQDSGTPIPITGAFLMRTVTWPHRDNLLLDTLNINRWFLLSRVPPANQIPIQTSAVQNYAFSNGAHILGLSMGNPPVLPHASQTWTPNIVWKAGQRTPRDYKFFGHLIGSDGRKYAQADPLSLPGQYWRKGETIITPLNFHIDNDLPMDGKLSIKLGMYDKHGAATTVDEAGTSTGDHAIIQIRGNRTPAWEFHQSLVLDAIDIPSEQLQGAPLVVNATWYAHKDTLYATQLLWQMATYNGKIEFEKTTALSAHPDSRTILGSAYLTTNYDLRIPPDITPQTYRLELQPIDGAGNDLGQPFSTYIHITPRNRIFTQPPMQHISGVMFAKKIILTGYDIGQDNHTLTLTLHWNPVVNIDTDYKYFVHVWANGELIAQADAMPDSGNYPTSWWAAHEFFSDTFTIELGPSAPKVLTLKMGLYTTKLGRIAITDVDGNTLPSATLQLGKVEITPDAQNNLD